MSEARINTENNNHRLESEKTETVDGADGGGVVGHHQDCCCPVVVLLLCRVMMMLGDQQREDARDLPGNYPSPSPKTNPRPNSTHPSLLPPLPSSPKSQQWCCELVLFTFHVRRVNQNLKPNCSVTESSGSFESGIGFDTFLSGWRKNKSLSDRFNIRYRT
jgi:hypothetical protein